MFKKRLICFVLSVVMLVGTVTTVHALSFKDVPSNSWYYEFVTYASEKGWMNGYGEGMFGPEDKLTKAQAVTIMVRALGLEPTSASEYWYSGFVETGIKYDIIKDDKNLNDPISRYEMAKMITDAYNIEPTILNAYDINSNLTNESPFIDIDDGYITELYNYGIIAGIETKNGLIFDGNGTLTRAHICTMLTRLDQHPLLSKKLANDSFVSNDYTIGYKYFIEKRLFYNKDCKVDKNVVEGLLYMVTNDLYYVDFTFDGNESAVKERFNDIFDIWDTLQDAYPEYFSIYKKVSLNAKYTNGKYKVNFYALPLESYSKSSAIVHRATLFKNAKEEVEDLVKTGVIKKSMTDYEKAYAVASWIVDNAQYDLKKTDESHYGSRFWEDGKIVCEGYTTLYNTMLKYLDINVYGVFGSLSDGFHMWSINELDDKWTYTDVTYMDPVDKSNPNKGYFNDDYFSTTEKELLEEEPYRTIDYDKLNKIKTYGVESWKI